MPTRLEYTSFLVRFWRRVTPTEKVVEWGGEIEHIQTGQRWSFDRVQDMLDFLRHRASYPRNWEGEKRRRT